MSGGLITVFKSAPTCYVTIVYHGILRLFQTEIGEALTNLDTKHATECGENNVVSVTILFHWLLQVSKCSAVFQSL